MFPPAAEQDRSAPRSLRAKLRNAADLAVAFMTLESYGLEDLLPARSLGPDAHSGIRDEAVVRPGPAPGVRAAVELAASAHRRELRTPARTRRPGTVAVREQPCTTPLSGTSTSGATAPASSTRRRTAAPDTPAT